MKELKVDETKCMGCGACVSQNENLFDFNEKGVSYVKTQENVLKEDGSVSEEIQEIIDSCPVGAIELVDKEEEKK